MSFTIRPLQTEDYPATTEIYNAQNEPHHQVSNAELKAADERLQRRPHYHLLSAVEDGEVIGRGQVGARQGDEEPGKFWTWFFVREDRQGRGVDSAMFDAGLELLSGQDPKSLWTCIREDFLPSLAYLQEREYQEQFRSWGAELVLEKFEPGSFDQYRHVLANSGVSLHSYGELASDPSRDTKLAALQAELEDDAPHHEPIIPKRHPTSADPAVLLDSYVVAVADAEYVGMACLISQGRFPSVAGSGLTGVKREYRGRGIGTALLAHTSAWAKDRGYLEVNGGGAGTNAPLLKAIKRVGFEVEPAWITLAKFL